MISFLRFAWVRGKWNIKNLCLPVEPFRGTHDCLYRTILSQKLELVSQGNAELFLLRNHFEGSALYSIAEPLNRFCKTPFFTFRVLMVKLTNKQEQILLQVHIENFSPFIDSFFTSDKNFKLLCFSLTREPLEVIESFWTQSSFILQTLMSSELP